MTFDNFVIVLIMVTIMITITITKKNNNDNNKNNAQVSVLVVAFVTEPSRHALQASSVVLSNLSFKIRLTNGSKVKPKNLQFTLLAFSSLQLLLLNFSPLEDEISSPFLFINHLEAWHGSVALALQAEYCFRDCSPP